MNLSRKSFPSGTVDIGAEGVVTALCAVSAVVDDVDDIIEVGALGRSIDRRWPKVVAHHLWSEPVARVEDAEELFPGDRRLPPDVLAAGGGGLQIRARFNLATERGREAFEDCRFFGVGSAEGLGFSIGYLVPHGGAVVDAKGIRRISDIDIFEASMVLFGAHPLAQLVDVKSANGGGRQRRRGGRGCCSSPRPAPDAAPASSRHFLPASRSAEGDPPCPLDPGARPWTSSTRSAPSRGWSPRPRPYTGDADADPDKAELVMVHGLTCPKCGRDMGPIPVGRIGGCEIDGEGVWADPKSPEALAAVAAHEAGPERRLKGRRGCR